MENIRQLFGKRVAELRKKQYWSQEQLAEMIGIDQRNLSKIETGLVFPRRCLTNIMKAFDIPMHEFFSWDYLSCNNKQKRQFLKQIIDELPPDLLTLCFRAAFYWKK